jgi:hypothetical protein
MMLKQQQHLGLCLTLSADTIAAIHRQVHGCEICSEQASLPFAELVVRLTGRRELSDEYVIADDVHCPSCINPLEFDTLVEIQHGLGRAAGATFSA